METATLEMIWNLHSCFREYTAHTHVDTYIYCVFAAISIFFRTFVYNIKICIQIPSHIKQIHNWYYCSNRRLHMCYHHAYVCSDTFKFKVIALIIWWRNIVLYICSTHIEVKCVILQQYIPYLKTIYHIWQNVPSPNGSITVSNRTVAYIGRRATV
jgi:hypothetical protein